MKKIDAIYKFGNLYDKATLKRILINDGSEVVIEIDPRYILNEDPNLKPEELPDAAKKELQITAFASKSKQNNEDVHFWKLFNADKLLYFEITAGIKRKEGKENIKTAFLLRTLEDLYIYNKRKEPKYCRFFDCHCIVEECLTDFKFFERLYATSLNDAYTKTYELYFAMFGKSTCNAFDRYFETSDMKEPLRRSTEEVQKNNPPL